MISRRRVMKNIRTCLLTAVALLIVSVNGRAQETASRDTSRPAGPAVTLSVTERGVRFAALGSFGKMRLEGFGADGASLYNSDFSAGSVRASAFASPEGQRL